MIFHMSVNLFICEIMDSLIRGNIISSCSLECRIVKNFVFLYPGMLEPCFDFRGFDEA